MSTAKKAQEMNTQGFLENNQKPDFVLIKILFCIAGFMGSLSLIRISQAEGKWDGWVIMFLLLTVLVLVVGISFLVLDLKDLHKKNLILQAIGRTHGPEDICFGLYWADTHGWDICGALEFATRGFTLADYQTYLQKKVDELSRQAVDHFSLVENVGTLPKEIWGTLEEIYSRPAWKKLVGKNAHTALVAKIDAVAEDHRTVGMAG